VEGTYRRRHYARYHSYSRSRKSKNRDQFLQNIGKQIVICTIAFLIILGMKNANTPFTNSMIEKISQILSYSIDMNNAYNSVETFVSKAGIFKRESQNKDKTTEVTPEPTESKDSNPAQEQPNHPDEEKQVEGITNSIDNPVSKEEFVAPLQGMVTSKFGLRIHPIEKKSRFHYGIDISGDKGVPFVAALSGQVEEVGYDSTNGNYIRLKHTDNVTTFYAHCSEIIVKKGEQVKANQVIGKVGDTGLTAGAHLHFEIWKEGMVLDPLKYIQLPLSPELEESNPGGEYLY